MGAVKAWLMEMEEYARKILESHGLDEEGRQLFLKKYPSQERIYNNMILEAFGYEVTD